MEIVQTSNEIDGHIDPESKKDNVSSFSLSSALGWVTKIHLKFFVEDY